MSYSIIFETKIVKLQDGRILHLSLQGCNNDDAGRSRDDFRGKIYTNEEFVAFAEDFCKDSKPMKESEWHDLKIGSRYATWYDYGQHLLRMLNRATTWDVIKTEKYACAEIFEGVDVTENGVVTFYSPAEWEKIVYDFMYGRREGKWRNNYRYLFEEADIIKALEENKPISFSIQ